MFTAKSSQETIVLIYTLTKNISRPILHPRPLQFLNLSKVASSPNGSVVKNPSASAGDTRDAGLIPGSGRSPGGRNGNPLQ